MPSWDGLMLPAVDFGLLGTQYVAQAADCQ